MHKIPDNPTTINTDALLTNLQRVKKQIAQSAKHAGRPAESVNVLAVSKTKPAAMIKTAFEAGQSDFGENYLGEALEKMEALAELPLIWHFIGPIQSNKTRAIAEHFHWVHSVERLKVAERLNQQRPESLAPLQVCLQINIDGESSKSGCTPEQALALAQSIQNMTKLKLRGLMCIPKPGNTQAFAELARLKDDLESQLGARLDTLSMGMSADLDEAIAAGATLVRVGTAIFGGRT